MYHRVGVAAYKANLDNTIAICNLLNNPQRQLQCIHIAGTNGKGSVSHMLASIFQAAGYKTGLYTSPHLKDFRERIRVNGKMISKKYISDFVTKYQEDFNRIQPSFFEMTVGLAFQYFFDKRTDIAIIETGLGGRLDSTNVISPVLSVITNIDWDHMNLLGNTLKKIAGEKAGIIKTNTPVVIGESNKATDTVFRNKSKQEKAPIYFASNEFNVEYAEEPGKSSFLITNPSILINVKHKKKLIYKNLELDLTGKYQLKNVLTVLQSISLLMNAFNITEKNIRKGLANVQKSTGLAGRWQVIDIDPLIIVDTGHNMAGMKAVMEMINSIEYSKLHFVLGMVNDKEPEKIMSLLPINATYYFCKAAIPRGLDAKILSEEAAKHRLHGSIYKSVGAAFKAAKANSGIKDLIFVGGSNFTVAEVI